MPIWCCIEKSYIFRALIFDLFFFLSFFLTRPNWTQTRWLECLFVFLYLSPCSSAPFWIVQPSIY
jgi:hypothetical protein